MPLDGGLVGFVVQAAHENCSVGVAPDFLVGLGAIVLFYFLALSGEVLDDFFSLNALLNAVFVFLFLLLLIEFFKSIENVG